MLRWFPRGRSGTASRQAAGSTSRVRLRPYTEAHAQSLFEAARESVAEVHRWLPWCHANYQLGDALLSDWAFSNTDLVRLEIVAAVGNRWSQRVAEKVEAVREGVLRKRLLIHGIWHDAVVFSITRVDAPAA